MLNARIYEEFPLLCPLCGGQMPNIALITYSAEIRQIRDHIGVQTEPPRITPARGPPLWDGADVQAELIRCNRPSRPWLQYIFLLSNIFLY